MTRPSLSTPITPDLVRGALDVESTARGLLPHRLPRWARSQTPDPQLAMAEAQPSGVRLVVRTTATVLVLDTVPTKREYLGMGRRPDGVYDLVIDGRLVAQGSVTGGDTLVLDLASGTSEVRPGEPGSVRFTDLPAGDKVVEVWLPHDERTELVALHTDAPVTPAPPDTRRVWLHHGSSISHGSNATHPTGTWPAVAAALADVDLRNLGLGGSALLDPFIARLVRDTPADLISLKIGINLVNTDQMRLRALVPAVHGYLDTIRDGHPRTPLVVVSPILCPIHEDTPGPSELDPAGGFRAAGDPAEVAGGKLTLQSVRAALFAIIDQRRVDDPYLHLLDGRRLYDEDDAVEHPLPDHLHPDAATHRRMGESFARWAFTASGPFRVSAP